MSRWELAAGWLLGCASVALVLLAEERVQGWLWERKLRRAVEQQGKADAGTMTAWHRAAR